MKKNGWYHCFLPVLFMSIALTACKKNTAQIEVSPVKTDTLLISVEDSTLYGIAGEHGMSTFSLITDSGDTLLMSKTSEDGNYGTFYGSVSEGNRYAVIAADDKETVVSAINITELGRFVEHYSIFNGRLIFFGNERRDTVQIVSMDRDSLVIRYNDNHSERLLPKS